MSELAILENLQREDLTPIEEAIAFRSILDNTKVTHEELGKRIGKSRTYITNVIGLLKLPAVVMEDVNQKRLTMGHARALSKLGDMETIMTVRDEILSLNLSVRDVETTIRERYRKKRNVISSETMKPKPFTGSNHLLVPVSVKPPSTVSRDMFIFQKLN